VASVPLSGALAAVTTSVVGVIANLAIWFALQVLFREHAPLRAGWLHLDIPVVTSIDPAALGLAMLAAACLFPLHSGVPRTLGVTAGAGLVLRAVAAM